MTYNLKNRPKHRRWGPQGQYEEWFVGFIKQEQELLNCSEDELLKKMSNILGYLPTSSNYMEGFKDGYRKAKEEILGE